ncbi:HAD-IA family hydrolase [Roseibacterium beibuensis]|uniref:HAD family hydrolase n=1 Tax=[Roseibacterium] beibuensis TaxID=1193142 RepID=A0ABP9LD17_9RHOB|nr:HAD-IA family hydrolase [Roseibacterium beibuensis]MCS6624404.1 HAD-IA family hydrolase [Roseibacterium beibuensis]
MSDLRLVIFDVDGTLVDSQAHILAAMARAFAANGLPMPPREAVLQIVGLSLPVAMARLAPDHPQSVDPLVEAYKDAFASLRVAGDGAALSPLFPGAMEHLTRLAAEDFTLLGVATGKSRRGLTHLFEIHRIAQIFHTVQVADDHPSKPNPSMIEACLKETGVAPDRAVILGDTSFDIEMGRAAGIHAIGVSWGYHPADALRQAGARTVLDDFAALPAALAEVFEPA